MKVDYKSGESVIATIKGGRRVYAEVIEPLAYKNLIYIKMLGLVKPDATSDFISADEVISPRHLMTEDEWETFKFLRD